MEITEEQRAILREIRRLDLLTFADAIEDRDPDRAESMRETARAMGGTDPGELAASCECEAERSLTHDARV